MEIPELDHGVLGDPALTRARDRVAEMVQKTPYIRGMMDDTDVALLRQCEGNNIFPRLQRMEANAHIGQVIFEVRGKVSMETLRLLEFYEPADLSNTWDCLFPLQLKDSMRLLNGLHYIDEQRAVLQAAFARRNSHLHRLHDRAVEEERTKKKTALAYRLMALEDSYRTIMGAIGAMPGKDRSVY